jgi:hypothetical protein
VMSQLNIWYICMGALLVAALAMPYDYYNILRLFICGSSIFLLVQHKSRWPGQTDNWTWGLIALAVVFNPVVPIHLPKTIWVMIDIASVVFLYKHYQMFQASSIDAESEVELPDVTEQD